MWKKFSRCYIFQRFCKILTKFFINALVRFIHATAKAIQHKFRVSLLLFFFRFVERYLLFVRTDKDMNWLSCILYACDTYCLYDSYCLTYEFSPQASAHPFHINFLKYYIIFICDKLILYVHHHSLDLSLILFKYC